jgi:transporter family-2 protein
VSWLSYVFALFAGALVTFQAGSNSQLKKSLEEPLPALIINYLVGMTAVFACTVLMRVPITKMSQASAAPWWAWIGGLFGAVYGLAAILLASQLGAATMTREK